MSERKMSGDKYQKYPDSIKRQMIYKFSRLFQFSDINIPMDLQKFIASDKPLTCGEFYKNNTNKIRVILKINECKDTPSCLTINKNQNCISLIDPTPSRRTQASNSSVNMFPFDSIFTENDNHDALLSNSLIDPILNFFYGKDACVFSFGNSGLGKTKTMIGSNQSSSTIGVIPCALAWIFKCLEQRKTKKQIDSVIRISALEIANTNVVRDLLSNTNVTAGDRAATSDSSAQHVSLLDGHRREVRVDSLPEAAAVLDSVLSARSIINESLTHLHLIIHLYQYNKIDANKCDEIITKPALLPGKSRLHFLDLGSGRHGNDNSSILSLQGMSKVILALYMSQRHIPYKENVLTQLLKETLGHNTATTMIVHISSKEQNYNETLQIVQLASKLYRNRSRKSRSVGYQLSDETSSCSSSSSGFHSRRLRPHMGIGSTRRSCGNSSTSSELDLTSASELSCCETVIFRGSTQRADLKPMSSESDFVNSDNELSRKFESCSPRLVSPSINKKHRISPRTNARAWPSTTTGQNTCDENGPELWVDGPNAVYKSDTLPELEKDVSIPKSQIITKPLMISKETQCDDVWDSGSSITDESSHSNTLDRKDNRPLSDISECTEETESILATETELVNINIMDDIDPLTDLDDLLESTFGLSQFRQNVQQNSSGKEIFCPDYIPSAPSQCQIVIKKDNIDTNSQTTQQVTHAIKSSHKAKEHYHSSADSRKLTKSDQMDKRGRSKCKKCSKRPNDPTSIANANSTDFSRVTSWIRSVEFEKQSTQETTDNDDVFLNNAKSYQYTVHTHHQSEPDISYNLRSPNALTNFHERQFPIAESIIDNDLQYSLYGRSQMYPKASNRIELNPSSHKLPRVSQGCVLPLENVKDLKNHKHSTNFVLNRYSPTIIQPPLPPLPQQAQSSDHRKHHRTTNPNQFPLVPQRENSINSSIHNQQLPKCKTLPRDMYSDPKCTDSRYHVPRIATHCQGQGIPVMPESILNGKNKKESKNIISILFAPFISLRKKINRSKCNLVQQKNSSENDLETSLKKECYPPLISEWPMIGQKSDPEFLIRSPYHLVTPPKAAVLATESSGHCSDSSSLHNRMTVKPRSSDVSKQHKCRDKSFGNHSRSVTRQRPTSSGYGSIIIKCDSEVSSHNDSSSEYSMSGPKPINCRSKIKHSLSLSNCKTLTDKTVNCTPSHSNEDSRIKNVTTAQDLIIREKLRISLNEERKLVIDYIETSRLRGIPVDAFVMNLTCFKGIDSVEICDSTKRDQCQCLIELIDQEMEQLKLKLTQTQHHLLLITSFDSKSQ